MPHTYEYPRPAVTVDAVIYHLMDEKLQVLLIRRKEEPFKDHWALPGGFMDMNETPEEAVKRELQEETGIEINEIFQVGAFGALGRDPRYRTISIAHLSVLSGERPKVRGADDALEAAWFPLEELPEAMAFDHHDILYHSHIQLCMQLSTAEAESPEAFGLSETDIQFILQEIADLTQSDS